MESKTELTIRGTDWEHWCFTHQPKGKKSLSSTLSYQLLLNN